MFTQNNQPFTYLEVLQRASSFLEKNGNSNFAAEWLMRERLGWTKTDLVKHHREKITKEQLLQFEQDLENFIEGMPMQQIIGHDWFFDRKFKVTSDTLIPRPETEEWLDKVMRTLPKTPLKVLDIGTGTGILAITTKLERPEDTVIATDISESALAVAQENAQTLEAKVTFRQGSLFEPVVGERFDVILSNPPYISYDELSVMDQSVIDYEPNIALFAEKNGLAIYEEMAQNISKHVHSGTCIFLEIGYKQGQKVVEIFEKALPQAKIEIWQDFNHLDRVVVIFCE